MTVFYPDEYAQHDFEFREVIYDFEISGCRLCPVMKMVPRVSKGIDQGGIMNHPKTTGIKEYDSLKADVVTIVGANSDGKHLFLEVEVFDGEHTNRFETTWPAETKAKEITEYVKSIIEKNPKLDPEIVGLMNKKVFWDKDEKGWYMQDGQQKPVRIDAHNDGVGRLRQD